MFVALYSTRLVLQLLGTVDYGIYNVVCGFVAMFGVFNTCFSATISRFYNIELGKKYNSRIAVVFSTSIFIQLVLAIIVTLILGFIGGWYINNVMVLPLERLSTTSALCLIQR